MTCLGGLQPLHAVGVLAGPDEDVRPDVEDEGVPVVHGRPGDVGQLPQDWLPLPLLQMKRTRIKQDSFEPKLVPSVSFELSDDNQIKHPFTMYILGEVSSTT